MPESETTSQRETSRRFLTFRIEERLYALPAEQISEVIRTPAVARVPHGPKSLMGLANLRGIVLPVASVRGLLGRPERVISATSRSIVLDGAPAVALAVDSIGGLVSIASSRIELRQAELSRADGEELVGAFQSEDGADVAKVLDIRRLLESAFLQRGGPERHSPGPSVGAAVAVETKADDRQKLVTFEVAGQEYGIALDLVQEIIPAPERIAVVPQTESLALGVIAYRRTLLPLLSLRGLLGFPIAETDGGRRKVVVTAVGGALVGLVVDRMSAIVSADAALLEPMPPMLAARIGGEAKVKAIYRHQEGRRLISILAPDQLFREEVMRRLGEARGAANSSGSADGGVNELQFLVFSLGGEEFGLPIESVDEVARLPERITRIPKTPKFLEGVTNLRGEILPVIDQRRRFDMPALADGSSRRLIVLRTDRHRAGVIVDKISEVLRCAVDTIGEAPHMAGEATRLVNGVVNLEATGRMILLLDPAELLTRAERSLLTAFKPQAQQDDL